MRGKDKRNQYLSHNTCSGEGACDAVSSGLSPFLSLALSLSIPLSCSLARSALRSLALFSLSSCLACISTLTVVSSPLVQPFAQHRGKEANTVF